MTGIDARITHFALVDVPPNRDCVLELDPGLEILFKPAATNTGRITVQTGRGAVPLMFDGREMGPGDIKAGQTVIVDRAGKVAAILDQKSKGWRRHIRRMKAIAARRP